MADAGADAGVVVPDCPPVSFDALITDG